MQKSSYSASVETICANCKRKANSGADKCAFKLCSGCYQAQYCSRECQLADRNNHKVACKAAQANSLNSAKSKLEDGLFNVLEFCRNGDFEGIKREISRGVNVNVASNEAIFSIFTRLIDGRFYECAEFLLQHNANPNVHDEDGSTPLYIASMKSCENFVLLLLRYKANPNIRAIDGSTPLFVACLKCNDKCVSLLLQHNADPNITNIKECATPLHVACQNGYDKCALLLLQHNANPNAQTIVGYSPLSMACLRGYNTCVSMLLRHNADPNIGNNKDGFQPLHQACHFGHDTCVSLLLQNNADPNKVNSMDGSLPLHLACEAGHDRCVSLLLQNNADPNKVHSINGSLPLHLACEAGHDNCVLLLLQNNADPNKVNSMDGSLPLHLACEAGHDRCVSLLLKHKADPNKVHTTNGDYTSLHYACQRGHDKCVSLLLQNKADPNAVDIMAAAGFSPLHQASHSGHDKCVSLLLQHNANPNIASVHDRASSLHLACQHSHDKCVSLLLQAGANTEGVTIFGVTPFLSACFCGHLKCAALLVEHGANIHVKKVPQLNSAVLLSCMSKNANLVAYILSLGVDANVSDIYGTTPMQYCHKNNLEKCARVLIEYGADESVMTKPLPTIALMDQVLVAKELSETKKMRQKKKHCDYPDCCNEGNDNQSTHACSSCRAVYYCGREHQAAHWKEHKKLCKAIKK